MNIDIDIIREMRSNGQRAAADDLLTQYRNETALQKKMAENELKAVDAQCRQEVSKIRQDMGLCRVIGCNKLRLTNSSTCKHHRDLYKKYKSGNHNI